MKIGDEYDRLTVKGEPIRDPKSRRKYVECVCKCGRWVMADVSALERHHKKSCGCLAEEIRQKHRFKEKAARENECSTQTANT